MHGRPSRVERLQGVPARHHATVSQHAPEKVDISFLQLRKLGVALAGQPPPAKRQQAAAGAVAAVTALAHHRGPG